MLNREIFLKIEKYMKDNEIIKASEKLGEAIVSEIPGYNIIKNIITLPDSIERYFFEKKIVDFLSCIQDIPINKRMKVLNKMASSGIYRDRIGMKLLEIISRINSDVKPEILGNLFKSFVEEKITYNRFLKLAFYIENSNNQDLLELKECNELGKIKLSEEDFYDEKLMELGIGTWDGNNSEYNGYLTEVGKEIVRYGWLKEIK